MPRVRLFPLLAHGVLTAALLGLAVPAPSARQTTPPPAAAAKDALLARLAIELAADRDPRPLSLDRDGSSLHGVVYDRFAHAHLTARVAKQSGAPLDPLHPPAKLVSHPLVVVAVPLVCDARTVAPMDVDIDKAGQPVYKWLPAKGAEVQMVLPGGHVAAGAIAVQFSDTTLERGEVIRITYAGPVCTGSGKTVELPVSMTTASVISRPSVELTADQHPPAEPLTLDVGGIVDPDGRLRYTSSPQVTTSFGAAALASVEALRFEPARVNGTPTPWTGGVIVTFYGGRGRLSRPGRP